MKVKITKCISVGRQGKQLFNTPTSKPNSMLPVEQSGTRFETHAATLGVIKIRKLRRIDGGAAVVKPCLGGTTSLELSFLQSHLDIFPRNMAARL
jgi:hypothetical protein